VLRLSLVCAKEQREGRAAFTRSGGAEQHTHLQHYCKRPPPPASTPVQERFWQCVHHHPSQGGLTKITAMRRNNWHTPTCGQLHSCAPPG